MVPDPFRNEAEATPAPRAWLFPGQGTQRRGMGADYFDKFPSLVALADAILGYSIRTLCLEDPDNQLGDTQFSQPAMFVVSALQFLHKRRHEPWPDVLAGHSLGEYNALFAAGTFDFETGLRLVEARARCMRTAGTGSMLAVIGMDRHELRSVMQDCGHHETIEFANYNLPDQMVLSGPDRAITELEERLLLRQGVRAVHLRVGGAFHSRYAAAAADQFNRVLADVPLADPKICTISSATARPIAPGEVREILRGQITGPVDWVGVMTCLATMGVINAEQIGPGRVLDGLWERFHDPSIRHPGNGGQGDSPRG